MPGLGQAGGGLVRAGEDQLHLDQVLPLQQLVLLGGGHPLAQRVGDVGGQRCRGRPPGARSPGRPWGSPASAGGRARKRAKANDEASRTKTVPRPREAHADAIFSACLRACQLPTATFGAARRDWRPAGRSRRICGRALGRASVNSHAAGRFRQDRARLRRPAAGVRRVRHLHAASVHRARQGVVANEAYLELQGAVDAAWKSLNDFAPSLGRAGDRLDPNLPLALRTARKHIDDAVGAIDRYLEKAPGSPLRARLQLCAGGRSRPLGRQLDALAAELGGAEAASQPRARSEFESHFATLVHGLNRMRQPLRGASGQIAQRLSRRRGDGAVGGDHAGRGRAGGGAGGLSVHAAHVAAARRAAAAGAAGGGGRVHRSGRA